MELINPIPRCVFLAKYRSTAGLQGAHQIPYDDDDDDRDGPRNVGSMQTPDAADSSIRFHKI
jgi:hypothetical protein